MVPKAAINPRAREISHGDACPASVSSFIYTTKIHQLRFRLQLEIENWRLETGAEFQVPTSNSQFHRRLLLVVDDFVVGLDHVLLLAGGFGVLIRRCFAFGGLLGGLGLIE